MSDLIKFLRARLDEDEAAAETWRERDLRPLREVEAKRAILAEHASDDHWCARPPDPDWVVYEGGERLVRTYPCGTLRTLAAIYSDHPDYQQEWKP